MVLFGQKAAKILHSPHDAYGIDYLLDKYIDEHYELTQDEWRNLLTKCEIIENDKSKTKGERTLAAWLFAIANHKLLVPREIAKRMVENGGGIVTDILNEPEKPKDS
jgi:hypothetical protein